MPCPLLPFPITCCDFLSPKPNQKPVDKGAWCYGLPREASQGTVQDREEQKVDLERSRCAPSILPSAHLNLGLASQS